MRHLLLFAVSVLISIPVVAQVSIEKFWGAKGYDVALSSAPTTDGGYIISGLTISGADKAEGDIVVIKLNAHADTMWALQVGGPKLEGGNYVIQTSDGGYMVSGHTEDFGASDCDAFLMKLDKAGKRQWLKVYGGDLDDIAEGVTELNDGFAFAGITENFGGGPDGHRNIWLVRTNTVGDTVWTRSYGGPGAEYANSIVHLPQGGFLAAGFSNSWSSNGADNAWLLRLKENGDTVSTSLYHTPGSSRFQQIIPVKDGGYILVGHTSATLQGSFLGFVVKLDKDGKELWQKTYGSAQDGVAFNSVAQLPDGKLMFSGISHKQDTAGTAYILTTSATGDLVGEQYAGSGKSFAMSVSVQGTSSYLIAGVARTTDAEGDIYYMEHDASMAGIPAAHAVMPTLFPNPVTNTLRIILPASVASQSTAVSISDVDGRGIYTGENEAGKDLLIDCKAYSKGIYTYRILSHDGSVFTGSFSVE